MQRKSVSKALGIEGGYGSKKYRGTRRVETGSTFGQALGCGDGHSGTAAHVAVPGVHIVLHHAALTHDKNNVKSIFEPDFF